jgi:hypothetical protein
LTEGHGVLERGRDTCLLNYQDDEGQEGEDDNSNHIIIV